MRLILVKRGLNELRPTVNTVRPPCRTVASGKLLFACPGSLSRSQLIRTTLTIDGVSVEVSCPVTVSLFTSDEPVCSRVGPFSKFKPVKFWRFQRTESCWLEAMRSEEHT